MCTDVRNSWCGLVFWTFPLLQWTPEDSTHYLGQFHLFPEQVLNSVLLEREAGVLVIW